ncbi:MAG: hypothetical protein ACL7BU_07135 [Candidatus Phlomobacter fragariae]
MARSSKKKQMDLFDQAVSASNEKKSLKSAMSITEDEVKASSDPNKKVYAHRCNELSAQ